MNALRASQAYRLWAPSYSDETAISFLEERLARSITPPLDGARLLDAGCGTGRRLRGAGEALAIGLDQSAEMLSTDGPIDGVELVTGDVRDMPFENGSFDIIWCRLVLGHLSSIAEAYSELGRVADTGATIIVSDFHPAAFEAGHRRTFRLGEQRIEVEHHVHHVKDHVAAGRSAGLSLVKVREGQIGAEVRSFYEKAGRLEAFAADLGLPVVLALSFRKRR